MAIALESIVFTELLAVVSLVPYSDAGAFDEFFSEFIQDFPKVVLHCILGFLLFAAELEMEQQKLYCIWSNVFALSIFSTKKSTIIVSVLAYLLMQSVNEMMEFKLPLV